MSLDAFLRPPLTFGPSPVRRPNRNVSARWKVSPMNVEATSSRSGGPHPKRSKPPLSCPVPTAISRCPCVTPSREMFVTVVSFMVAVSPYAALWLCLTSPASR